MIITILFIVSLVINLILIMIAKRFAFRSLQYDDAIHAISDDFEIFIDYTDSLLEKSLFSRSPEIVSFTNNLKIMRNRFESFVDFSNENTIRKKEVKPTGNPPVVVD